MSIGATSEGREILFKLRLATDPRNSDTASKFHEEASKAKERANGPAPSSPRGGGAGAGGAGGSGGDPNKDKKKSDADYAKWWKKTLDDNDREEQRVHDRMRDRSRSRAKRNREELEEQFANAKVYGEKRATEDQKASEKSAASYASAKEKMRASSMQIREGGMMAAEGIMSVARGAALLGVMGEKDLAKFVQQVAQIEGVFSIVRGGASVWFGLSKALEAYQLRVNATTAAETALAAAQARRAITAAAANAAGGGGPAGPTQGLSGSASSMSAQGMNYAKGATATSATGSLVGAAALGAAITSISMVFQEASEIINGTSGEVDSLTSRMGRFNEWVHRGVLDAVNPQGAKAAKGQVYTKAAEDAKAAERAEERLARDKLRRQGREMVGSVVAGHQGSLVDKTLGELAFKSATANMRGSANQTDTESAASNAFSEKHQLSALKTALETRKIFAETDEERKQAQADIEKVQQRMIDNAKEMVTLAQREGQEKVKAAKEVIEKTREEIQKRKDAAKEANDSLLTAKQRFGNLSDKDQKRALEAGRTAKEAMGLIESSGGNKRHAAYQQGQRMLAGISKEDRALLDSVGLEGPTKAAREAALQEADRVTTKPAPKGMDREAATRLIKIKEREKEIDEIEKNRAGENQPRLGMNKTVDFTDERNKLARERVWLEQDLKASMPQKDPGDRERENAGKLKRFVGGLNDGGLLADVGFPLEGGHVTDQVERKRRKPQVSEYDSVFGAEERAKAKAETEAQRTLELKVKDERVMILKVESDYVSQATALANQAAVEMKKLEQKLVDRFLTELESKKTEANQLEAKKAAAEKAAKR